MVEESKPPGGKVTLRRELIERGGSHEVRYGGGHGSRTPSVAGSGLTPPSPAPTKGASPLVRSPRRGRTPFETPGRGFNLPRSGEGWWRAREWHYCEVN